MEEVVWSGKPTVLAFYDALVSGGLLAAISIATLAIFPGSPFWWVPALGLAVAALLIVFAFIRAWANTYVITDKGVRREYRFVAVETSEVPFDKVTDIVVFQDIIGRALSFGTVRVDSAGTPFQGVLFRGVKKPEEVRRAIVEAREKAQMKG